MFKINLKFFFYCYLASLLASCSGTFYNSTNKSSEKSPDNSKPVEEGLNPGSGQQSQAAGEGVQGGESDSQASGEFFQEGKSLDLYVIMDKSSSLFHGVLKYDNNFEDPSKRGLKEFKPELGSDPECKRYGALKSLIVTLGKKLKNGEQVRMNVVTFGDDAKTIGSFENVLQDTESNLEKLRSGICDAPTGSAPYTSLTHYAKGILKSLANHKVNTQKSKLDVQTVLFFSDGAPKDDSRVLLNSLEQLKGAFPKRVFGVLLGTTPDECSLPKVNSQKKTTIECMLEVVDGNPKRLRQAENAEKLIREMTSLLD